MRRAAFGAIASAAVALVVAPAASADSIVSVSGSELRVSAREQSPGGLDRVDVVIEHFADANRNGIRVRQQELGNPPISSTDPVCTHNPIFNDVVCNGLPSRIVVEAAGASDDVGVGGSNVGCEASGPVDVIVNLRGGDDALTFFHCGSAQSGPRRLSPRFVASGGDGNDILVGNYHDDVMRGDAGNDTVHGGGLPGDAADGNDVVIGGAGNDTVEGHGGNDEVRGEAGNDTLRGQAGDDELSGGSGTDTVDGGAGVDRALVGGLQALTITLDGAANDGVAGEGDNYISIESLTGGDANDTFVGSAAAETLDGALGNDVITGGGGADVLRGGGGDDLIDARDGVADTISCGTGQDTVIADLADPLFQRLAPSQPRDGVCERIERFAVDDGPPGRPTGRSIRLAATGALAVRMSCPRNARVGCRGRLSIVDPRRPNRVLAAASYSIGRGRSAAVPLALTRVEAAQLRGRGVLSALTRERGVSKKGPRRTTTLLVVLPG